MYRTQWAIYTTTVSFLDGRIFVRVFVCTFSNCTLIKRKGDRERGGRESGEGNEKRKETVPSRIVPLSRTIPAAPPPHGTRIRLGVHGSADSLSVNRVRRVIRSQGVESAVRRGREGGRQRARRRFAVRMVSGAEGAQRRRGIGAAAGPVERRRRRQQRMRMRVAEERRRGGRVIAAAGEARVTA